MTTAANQAGETTNVQIKQWYDSGWKILLRILSNTLLVLAVVLAVALAVVPRVCGGHALTVLSGSMRPVLQPGDIVVTKGVNEEQVCSQVKVGDIVTFLPLPDDPTLVTHRVVEKSIGDYSDGTQCRFTTKGDDNSAVDEEISPIQIRGIFLYRLPLVGWVQNALGTTGGLLVGAVAVVAISYGIWLVFRNPRRDVPNRANLPTDSRSEE